MMVGFRLLARCEVPMPIHFACPLCGKQTVVSDQYAGQTGPCAACGGTITIPLTSSIQPGPSSPSSSSGASTVLVMALVLGVGFLICCGGAGMLFFVGRSQVQVAANRNLANIHLKQIGLALHMYHDTYGTFPPAVVMDEKGTPLYSGRVLLLPFLEQEGLYRTFDKTKAWDAPENHSISHTPLMVFQDPANTTAASPSRTDFVFVTGPGTIFDGTKSARFTDVHDGTSQTIGIVGTASGPDSWAAPSEWDVTTGGFPASSQPKGRHLVMFLDGSVQTLDPGYATQYLQQLVQIQDGQSLPPPR
jgi:hypothetical protein